MEKFKVYILFSLSSKKYYIGQTNDLERRMEEHNHISEHSYTSKHRPWELQVTLEMANRSSAMKAEKYLKKKPRDFIRRVILEEELRKYIKEKFSSSD